MTNEQLLYWIEGYLSDKFSIEACAIKNKINDVRGKPSVTPETTDFLQKLKPVPCAVGKAPWESTGDETAQWVGTDV